VVDVKGGARRVRYSDVTRAAVQVEFGRGDTGAASAEPGTNAEEV
jgi:hypothetical protein